MLYTSNCETGSRSTQLSETEHAVLYNHQRYHENYVKNGSCISNNLNSSLSASQTSLPPPPAPADLDHMMMLNNASLNAAIHYNNVAETNHNSHYLAPEQGQQRMVAVNGEGCVDDDIHLDGDPGETVSMECYCMFEN